MTVRFPQDHPHNSVGPPVNQGEQRLLDLVLGGGDVLQRRQSSGALLVLPEAVQEALVLERLLLRHFNNTRINAALK